jgi:hypothetical protein
MNWNYCSAHLIINYSIGHLTMPYVVHAHVFTMRTYEDIEPKYLMVLHWIYRKAYAAMKDVPKQKVEAWGRLFWSCLGKDSWFWSIIELPMSVSPCATLIPELSNSVGKPKYSCCCKHRVMFAWLHHAVSGEYCMSYIPPSLAFLITLRYAYLGISQKKNSSNTLIGGCCTVAATQDVK